MCSYTNYDGRRDVERMQRRAEDAAGGNGYKTKRALANKEDGAEDLGSAARPRARGRARTF
jgi:hypothetical protein